MIERRRVERLQRYVALGWPRGTGDFIKAHVWSSKSGLH